MQVNPLNEPTAETVGRNIRRWREFRELSGENLGDMIGSDKSTISKIKSDNCDLTLSRLNDIAKALGLSLHDLLYTDPQSLAVFTQHAVNNGVAYGTKHNTVDKELLNELRQQLKSKDDHIKFLQLHFPAK